MNVNRVIQYVSHLSAPDSALIFLFETRARPENNFDCEVPPPNYISSSDRSSMEAINSCLKTPPMRYQ